MSDAPDHAARTARELARRTGVDHHDVVVLIEHGDVERHRDFVGQFAIEIDVGTTGQHGGVIDHHSVGVDDFSGKDLGPGLGTKPVGQFVDHGSAVQPHPRGSQSVANGQRCRPHANLN